MTLPNKSMQPAKGNGFTLIFGLLLITAGILFLLKQFKVIDFDVHIWPLFLIFFGVLSGMRKGFARPFPIILIALGILFFIPEFTIAGVSSERLIWPVFLMLGGAFLIFGPKKKSYLDRDSHFQSGINTNPLSEIGVYKENNKRTENSFSIDAYFGGRKEMVTSKQFEACVATAICGGIELNLMQADSVNPVMVLDLRVLMGGVEIIIPSHWEIINEVDVLLGGVEDRRNLRTDIGDKDAKQLVIRGSISLGGLEIKSY